MATPRDERDAPEGTDPRGTRGVTDRTETIAAIATAPGESGIAIVRVSGPGAAGIVDRIARLTRDGGGRPRVQDAATHTVHHAWLRDPSTGRRIDEALISVFRAPRSYTGEDVVELGVHGGSVPARRVLRALLEAGARTAERGEFTRRAFVNGRMDLSRAESVIDLIRARTERAAEVALAGLAGGVARRTTQAESTLVDLLARLEVNLDFNEDVSAVSQAEIGERLRVASAALEELAARAPWGRRVREGASVVILGQPNVGKSSLFNALLEDDRALVSPTPGTTRDWIEAWIDIDGIPVRLIDTAGWRETEEAVEAEGVRHAQRLEEACDLRVVVLDGTRARDARDANVLARTANQPRLIVLNKCDEPGALRGGAVPADSEVPAEASPSGEASPHRISAKTGEGLADLRRSLGERLLQGVGREPDDDIVPGERHADALRRAVRSLDLARASWREGRTEELIAGDVRDAVGALGEITGRSVTEAVLDRVFASFCIGK